MDLLSTLEANYVKALISGYVNYMNTLNKACFDSINLA